MAARITLVAPLFTDWTAQYVRLHVADVQPGTPLLLTVNGAASPCQYTGPCTAKGAEILVRLGFAKGETKELQCRTQDSGQRIPKATRTNLERCEIPLNRDVRIGLPGRELVIPAVPATRDARPATLSPSTTHHSPFTIHGLPAVSGPFAGFADSAMSSAILCETAFEGASLTRTNDGPLFTDYELQYRFAEDRRYALMFRCYKLDPYVEVGETFSLRMNAELTWTLNPEKRFTHIISRDSFEGETQPTVEPLGAKHPRDVLCRLQMPTLSEYFIPNNRGWFALCDERDEARGMVGILGLYGAKWEEPVANMPEILDRQGTVEWRASLASGKRFWLLYAGPVERGFRFQVSGVRKPEGGGRVQGSGFGKNAVEGARCKVEDPGNNSSTSTFNPQPSTSAAADGRFLFHRLHAEFNALRLDEHLDLTSDALYDASCAERPGVFGAGDFHAAARQRAELYPCLGKVLATPDHWLQQNGAMHLASYRYLLEPNPANSAALHDHLFARFERWVRQFQGYRVGEHDYMKNVIGFSRYLRGMLLAYEMLRRDGTLAAAETHRFSAYFAFAARRILDEGRWPHSKTWKHPDHPESTRDFYTYGGEHKPDRLVWTNCLPNFQSDPMCALAHLSAIFRDHPDAAHWRRFALEDIDRQLDAYCGRSGAWEESINYALYTFSYFVITFKAVKARWGIDYFNDARVRRFAAWLCRFFGPLDKRFGVHTMPGVGNAVLPQAGGEYLLCYASELAADDPLRVDCLALWQRVENYARPGEHYPVVMAAMAPGGEVFSVRCSVFSGSGGARMGAGQEDTGRGTRNTGCEMRNAGGNEDKMPGGMDVLNTEHRTLVPQGEAPPTPAALLSLRQLASEVMDEVGVAMRDRHTQADESYLFQKIGFAKDHYEADETAFNWYAKGTPLCMDYGTYTGDVGVAGAHNLIEIPDADNLRRGYLAAHLFTPAVDYTHCEEPVTLKPLWGKVRSFAEVDNKDGKIDRTKTPYFYIGDNNPVGPKVWKVRLLLFVKPDYLVLFDRVYGQVPHRFNLHVTAKQGQDSVFGVQCSVKKQNHSPITDHRSPITDHRSPITDYRSPITDHRLPITGHRSLSAEHGALLTADGRFDLDLLAFVQHPRQFELETGELIPKVHPGCGGEEARRKHAQHYFRLYNKQDGIYRTLLFAKERGRDVRIAAAGENGVSVVTPEYTDYIFLHNDVVTEQTPEVSFAGRVGWIRRDAAGHIRAVVPNGDRITAFGVALDGAGPWSYNLDGSGRVALLGGPPRQVVVAPQTNA